VRAAAAAVVVLFAAVAARAEEGCGVCHGAERVQHETSVHADAGMGCIECHGGDPSQVETREAAHAADKGYLGPIARKDVPERCGTCHADVARMRPFGLRTDALAAYRTSHHGKALSEKGDEDVAVCTDCHGVHEVRPTDDPASPAFRTNVPETCGRCHADPELMEPRGLETGAPAAFAMSVHGQRLAEGAPGVPSCADCHDAHAAAPPGTSEVSDVCGHCHVETRERFRESPHYEASRRGSMQQCVTCHGNHSVAAPDFDLFDAAAEEDDDETGVHCFACHESGEEDPGHAVALAFGRGFRTAAARLDHAEGMVDAMAAAGFYADDERDSLARARRELVRAVPLTHAVDLPQIEASLRRVGSLVDEALLGRETKLREARDRRIYGTVTAFVLLGIAWFMALWRQRLRAR
jgi:hypothetical protein